MLRGKDIDPEPVRDDTVGTAGVSSSCDQDDMHDWIRDAAKITGIASTANHIVCLAQFFFKLQVRLPNLSQHKLHNLTRLKLADEIEHAFEFRRGANVVDGPLTA